jgi:hypothetical protein
VLGSAEPGARWAVLTGVLGRPDDDPEVVAARAAVLADPATTDLVGRLRDWESGEPFSGHDAPVFAPNLLGMLADMGVRAGDHPRIDGLLRQMLGHQDRDGRFQSYAPPRGGDAPRWGTLLCDTHAITEVLIRFGHGSDLRVRAALAAMAADLTDTAQGRAWPCRPDPVSGFRGPGRRGDCCPQVTLEALRTFALLPDDGQPEGLVEVVRTSLSVWRDRATSTPYMFGHGRSFKRGKWPATWYSALSVVDALGRYPQVWSGPRAEEADRRAMAELVACLLAYARDADGRVVPMSTYRGYQTHSMGRKGAPSPFATARVLVALARVGDLADEVAAVDVLALSSSKGGSGTARPPR